MAEEEPNDRTPSRRGSRKRGARSRLRKSQNIDHVIVEEPFQLYSPENGQESSKAGDGCYVSATINNRRFYGVLIDQASIEAGSLLYFKDEAAGMDLNRRMEHFLERREEVAAAKGDSPAQIHDMSVDPPSKRMKTEISPSAMQSSVPTSSGVGSGRTVQMFRYQKPSGPTSSGYRTLLGTFLDSEVAAGGDSERMRRIETACQRGGDYVGEYYYQYEFVGHALKAPNAKSDSGGSLRTSMAFQRFLNTTQLPDWYPLSNHQTGQQTVLNILNMKRDNNGNVIWGDKAKRFEINSNVEVMPMVPRTFYRVCVVGGGISGLSCCLELFRLFEREHVDVEVVLVEGRSRLGGRLWTDRNSFKTLDGRTAVSVDLGASWIHGIESNPLAALAKEAGADFVTTSEDVKMFQSGMREIDAQKDEEAGILFDKLLDLAAEDSWNADSAFTSFSSRQQQAAIRWYASNLRDPSSERGSLPTPSAPPEHRQSEDIPVDAAIVRAIRKHRQAEFASLSEDERMMLLWNLKNIEYALGANVSDLSMKYWDIDERHAFEGDHVLIRQGYSTVIDHIYKELLKRGERFRCLLDFRVEKVEYNRKTSSQAYDMSRDNLLELSDTCCITASNKDTPQVLCDFAVATVPLGVLKSSIESPDKPLGLSFLPPLPFVKRDAIQAVGFGLLNKVYLQFPTPFWHREDLLGDRLTQFGNASGFNPHHYMFLDIGRALKLENASPAILMSLISGKEAVLCETMSQEEVVREIMKTLRAMFSGIDIPDPVSWKVTTWGTDEFSRGSYTFLTPGTTDQDFEVLQSAVNGNGDSMLLEGSETMRLFFAGEHTTALHPSMAHGALLSGIRAASEVIDSIKVSYGSDEDIDQVVPMALFRYKYPKRALRCTMCLKNGARAREGNLLPFKRGSRHILCHSNCAEYSPEVEVEDGTWRNVLSAVNRSKAITCAICRNVGASMGCAHPDCDRCYHFSCAEDTGWRFDVDGKEYFCDRHRNLNVHGSRRISMEFFESRNLRAKAKCTLCGEDGESEKRKGDLVAYILFANQNSTTEKMAVVHENCIRYTSIVDLGENKLGRMDLEFRNVFEAIESSSTCRCSGCNELGGHIRCTETGCGQCFHLSCVPDFDWGASDGKDFKCQLHRSTIQSLSKRSGLADGTDVEVSISHNVNDDSLALPKIIPLQDIDRSKKIIEMRRSGIRMVRLFRKTKKDKWNLDLFANSFQTTTSRVLIAASFPTDPFDSLESGDLVRAINGFQIGSHLDSLQSVLSYLKEEVDVFLEVHRFHDKRKTINF